MDNILVVVPPEWTPVSYNIVADMTGFTWNDFANISGRITDVNDRLESRGYFTNDLRVIDVLVVLGEQLYFKFG